ncbi:MAG: hypothetical protein JWM09_1379 [Francisellaceae bacterium]|nr:hypothetical protein [Francisellaceae bacterium]
MTILEVQKSLINYCKTGNLEKIKEILLTSEISPNFHDDLMIKMAAIYEHLSIVGYLIDLYDISNDSIDKLFEIAFIVTNIDLANLLFTKKIINFNTIKNLSRIYGSIAPYIEKPTNIAAEEQWEWSQGGYFWNPLDGSNIIYRLKFTCDQPLEKIIEKGTILKNIIMQAYNELGQHLFIEYFRSLENSGLHDFSGFLLLDEQKSLFRYFVINKLSINDKGDLQFLEKNILNKIFSDSFNDFVKCKEIEKSNLNLPNELLGIINYYAADNLPLSLHLNSASEDILPFFQAKYEYIEAEPQDLKESLPSLFMQYGYTQSQQVENISEIEKNQLCLK